MLSPRLSHLHETYIYFIKNIISYYYTKLLAYAFVNNLFQAKTLNGTSLFIVAQHTLHLTYQYFILTATTDSHSPLKITLLRTYARSDHFHLVIQAMPCSTATQDFHNIYCMKNRLTTPWSFPVMAFITIHFTSKQAILQCINTHYFALRKCKYKKYNCITEMTKEHKSEFLEWKETFESRGLKVNHGKTKMVVSGSITKDDISKSKVDPCGVCSLRAKLNTVLCVYVVCCSTDDVQERKFRPQNCKKKFPSRKC